MTHYTLDKELGRGQYGICCKAIRKKTKEVFAVKSIAKCKLNYREEIEDINREVEILHLAWLGIRNLNLKRHSQNFKTNFDFNFCRAFGSKISIFLALAVFKLESCSTR